MNKGWFFKNEGWVGGTTRSQLESGAYTTEEWNGEIFFTKQQLVFDNIIDLPGLPTKMLVEQIDSFWGNNEIYRKIGFSHKRGIILYGPPGNGKTMIVQSLIKNTLEKEGIALLIRDFYEANKALRKFRDIQPNTRIITVMEDVDALLTDSEKKIQEQNALSMLDGETQVNGIVHIATTNYPEKLADRFIKRPGRFDLVVGMGYPSTETRAAYFRYLLKDINEDKIRVLAQNTEGLGLAHLREVVASHICLGLPLDEVTAKLKSSMKTKYQGNAHFETKMGFTLGYDECLSA